MSTKSAYIILDRCEIMGCSSCDKLCRGSIGYQSNEARMEVVVDDHQDARFYCQDCVEAGKSDESQ